ncbi:MAG TPA: VIT1/CCC1 family protein [Thermomicrobiaceae bacterium]|nr:VIT1/CCC1 family protein [Thermomicrobiaceae bacterium]
MTPSDIARYQANLQSEIDGVALYRALASMEATPELAAVYRTMADDEERHAALWRERLTQHGGAAVPALAPSWRTRALIRLARWFGPGFILPTVAAHERLDSRRYRVQEEAAAAGLPAEERAHARLFRTLSAQAPAGVVGSTLARIETGHRGAGGNALRAAVLGANDGLVSNTSLVMGVVGAELAGRGILVAGIAGLLAGSFSMALGEWLSVQSARELYERQIEIERQELETFPAEEERELALIYRAKGLPAASADALAAQLIQDPAAALETLAREELGIDPDELGGSAWTAALVSFVLFSVGAIIPVAPFLVTSGTPAVIAAIVLSILALFVIGAGITIITGRAVLASGLRQVVFGVLAAAITFGIGRLIGVEITG